MATNGGIYRQPLKQSIPSPSVPKPLINGIRLFNKPIQLDSHAVTREDAVLNPTGLFNSHLRLEYEQDLITFEFVQPGIHSQSSLEGFRYRLVPFDRGWNVSAEDENKATYTRLPPGEYEFQVQLLGQDPAQTATFSLSVIPPWYLTWWARILGIALIIIAFFAIFVYRTHRLAQRNLLLQRLRSVATEHDLIARWGGEEFLILIRNPSKSDTADLFVRAKSYQKVIGATPMQLSTHTIYVSLTGGVCYYQGQSFEACLQLADKKLYEGKNAGRNCLVQ